MDYDALVVGGGGAGLSAVLVVGRARRRTLLIDGGRQSNHAAHQIGGLLGQPRTSPAELYATGRARVMLGGGMNYELPDTPGAEGLEHRVPLLREWSDDVVVLGDDRPVASVAPGVVRFEDGGELEVGALHVVAQLSPRDALAAQLDIATKTLPDAAEVIEADSFGATSVDGVFAAGDITTSRNLAMAIGTGNMAATGLHRSLVFA